MAPLGAGGSVDKRARARSNAVRHVYTFIEHARSKGVPITHVMEFTDNTSAEHSAERGRPSSERMQALVTWRYARLMALQTFSSVERVASVDNDVADGLSRGGSKLADALRIMGSTRMAVRCLTVDPEVRSLEHLRALK